MRVFQTGTFVFGLLVAGLAPVCADPFEPARGSQLRLDFLDTVRVIAEYELGAPVEFVVIELQY